MPVQINREWNDPDTPKALALVAMATVPSPFLWHPPAPRYRNDLAAMRLKANYALYSVSLLLC